MHRLFEVLPILCFTTVEAQFLETTHIWDNWQFGDQGYSQSFATDPPTVQGGGSMVGFHEGSASISDSTGQLLFYTDGCTIWDRQHSAMPLGSGIGYPGCFSSNQSSLIVPWPQHPGLYYVFCASLKLPLSADTLFASYSMVDMELNGGFGDVIASTKNTVLCAYHDEQQVAIPHANGEDLWLILHEGVLSQYMAFRITPQGIDTVPVISTVPSPPDTANYGANAQMCASVQGDRLAALARFPNRVEVCSFNNATGEVQLDYRYVDEDYPNTFAHGACFSPDGSRLYLTRHGILPARLWQFNANAVDEAAFVASRALVENYDGQLAQMGIGPDEKIYISGFNEEVFAVINAPNAPAAQCDFVFSGIPAPGAYFDIPNMIYWPQPLTTDASDMNEQRGPLIYPQPMHDQAMLEIPGSVLGLLTLTWLDVSGRVVREERRAAASAIKIDRAGLPDGLYTLMLGHDSHAWRSFRVLVN